MSTIPIPRGPADVEQLPAWSWTPPADVDAAECRHGLSNPAWCCICSPAVPAASRPEVPNGER